MAKKYDYDSFERYRLPSEYKRTTQQNVGMIPFSNFVDVDYWEKYVTVEGVLSKVYPPRKVELNDRICPQCHSKKNLIDIGNKNEYSIVFPITEICGNCSDTTLLGEEDKWGHRTVKNTKIIRGNLPSGLIESEPDPIRYHLQRIVFKSHDSQQKLNVMYYIREDNRIITEYDIGKKYSIEGWLTNMETYVILASDRVEEVIPPQEEEGEEKDIPVENENCEELVGESRDIPGYDEWRKEVLSRDKHCVVCGGDKHLHVHHLYGYKEYPDLRVDVSNGVTVCKFCHERYHSYYGLSDITPDKFIQFMRRFVVR